MAAGTRDIPSYCFSSNIFQGMYNYFDPACQPYTDTELHQMSVQQMEQIAKVNPVLAEQGIALADQYQAQAMSNDNSTPPDTGTSSIWTWALVGIGIVAVIKVLR